MPTAAETDRGPGVDVLSPRQLCLAFSSFAVVAVWLGSPVLWAAASTLGVAFLIAGSSRVAWQEVPLAVLFVVSAVSGTLFLAGLLGARILGHAVAVKLLLTLLNGVVAGVAIVRGSTGGSRGEPGNRIGLLGILPFMLMCLLALVMALEGPGARTGWFLGGDNLRHLGLVTRIWQSGALDYEQSIYPRAWHGFVAGLWTSTGPSQDNSGLTSLVATHAVLTWLLAAVLSLALGVVAGRLACRFGASGGQAGLSALLAGAAFLGPQFLGAYLVRGFQANLLATLILVVTVGEVLTAPRSRRSLVVSALAVALTAHTWQIMLPAAVVLCVIVVLARWRRGLPRSSLVVDASVLGIAGAVALAGVQVVSAVGGSMLGSPGDVPRPPYLWLTCVIICCLWAAARHWSLTHPVILTVAVVVATALGIAWRSGVPVGSYYPNKTLWTTVVLGLPLLAVATTEALARLDEARGPLRSGFVVAGAAVGLGFLVSMAAPVVGIAGSWSTADGDLVMSSATSAGGPRASIVWGVSRPIDDATIQVLLDFYSASAASPGVALAPRDLDAQCDVLVGAVSPVVMSAAPEAEVRARFACAPSLSVVPAGGR